MTCDAFELQTDDIPCKLIAAVFHRENYERRLSLDEAEKYAKLFAAAPALLEALNQILFIADCDEDEEAEPMGSFVKIKLLAKAAIEQAEKEG